MHTPMRDLATPEHWERSIERSRHRREITPDVRRRLSRRRRASAALTTLMIAGPTGQAFGAIKGDGTPNIAGASPATRAIDTPQRGLMFKVGSNGPTVAEIQRVLGIPADGIYGALTQRAVRDFQARNGLLIDGVVGPATWTSLFGLEDAAMSAGAAQGDVAVIVREVPKGDTRPVAASSASAAAPAAPAPASPQRDSDEGDAAVGAPDRGDDRLAARERAKAPTRAEDPARAEQPARPEARAEAPRGGDPEPAKPETRPVSNPAPAAGDCGLRLATPVKGIETSPFGPRGGRNHDGLDISAPTGTPIRAAECGIVSFRGAQSGYGNLVCVKHTDRLETCYAHMSRFAASSGQKVRKGQVIGYVGSTGFSTGPHLHFETRVDGQARDPKPYLRGSALPGRATVQASSERRSASSSRARGGQRVSASNQRRATTRSASVSRGGAHYDEGMRSSGGTRSTSAQTSAPAPAETVAPAPVAPAPVAPAPVEAAPVPVEEAPVPVEAAPVEAAPVEAAPVEAAPVEAVPVEEAPVEAAPVEPVPVEEAPVEAAPVEPVPVAEAPVDAAPVEAAPVEPVPVEEAPVEPAPVGEVPLEEAPVEAAPIEAAPVEPIAEEAPVAPVEETAPGEPAPVAAAPVEEAAPIEPVVEETLPVEPVTPVAP